MVIKWVRDDWNNATVSYDNSAKQATLSVSGNRTLDSDASMNFTVYNAIGGKVVEFRQYDRRVDRSNHQVYVIGSDEDFGAKIAKIATMESLKN